MTQILGEDLARIVSNTMKFVNPKSIYLPSELLFNLTVDELQCYACDDYIAITDYAKLSKELFNAGNSPAEETFVLSLEDAKDLERFARENKKSDIGIKFSSLTKGRVQVAFSLNEATQCTYSTGEFRQQNWDLVDAMLFDDFPKTPFYDLSFNPERFTKFSQLKHNKDAPMHWELLQLKNTPIVRFTLGDTITGVIRPLNLEDGDSKS